MSRIDYIIEERFDAAHRLPDYDGPCSNMHGHTWTVRVCFAGGRGTLPESGMHHDLKDLAAAVKAVIEPWDHCVLNQKSDTLDQPPTAENLANSILKQPLGYETVWVEVEETPGRIVRATR